MYSSDRRWNTRSGEHPPTVCALRLITSLRHHAGCFRALTRAAIWGQMSTFLARWQQFEKRLYIAFPVSRFHNIGRADGRSTGMYPHSWPLRYYLSFFPDFGNLALFGTSIYLI